MHVAEQTAENGACLREYGSTPVQLLSKEGLLGHDFTAVHAINISDEEIAMLAKANATICSCPTTERNLAFQRCVSPSPMAWADVRPRLMVAGVKAITKTTLAGALDWLM